MAGIVPRLLSFMKNDCFERHSMTSKHSLIGNITMAATEHSFLGIKRSLQASRSSWRIAFALDTGPLPDNNNNQEGFDNVGSGLGGTRLGRIVGAAASQLLEKLNSARKNFPTKVFLLLLGFYTANALATILGQTGDWDVLVAGIVVTAIEGIGMLMYRKPSPMSSGRLQSLVVMINYWKAGVCLGLFVDAFKLASMVHIFVCMYPTYSRM